MSQLTLNLFGQFEAHLGGRPLPGFRTNKVQALLVYLAAEPTPHNRESLMGLLWPGMPERSGRHNLRQVLYYLRGMIPQLLPRQRDGGTSVPFLLANRQTIGLNREADVSTDIGRFDDLLWQTQSHEHLNLAGCPICRQHLEEAVALYRGPFLADFYLDDSNEFEDWAQVRREAFRRAALDALEILTVMALRRKEYSLARSLAERQLEIDNLRESSYRQLMEALALSGRREEALAVYEGCRRLLAEELAMAPTRRTTDIHDKIVAGDLSFDQPHLQGVRGYEIKEEIAAGAYGTIHRAVQLVIGREVAVKVIRRKYANSPEFIRRFEEEARTVARLEHPYVVPLYDYWRDPDGAYLVMRYMKGGSLLDALGDGPWDPAPTVRLVEQIASALALAHERGIVHRDIKPANILLDEEGNAYLSDFGIARGADGVRPYAASGTAGGTPDYISPEEILNEPAGPQSDIYSLGAVIFEILTGEKPFGTGAVANLIYRHLHEPFPFVAESRPGLPPPIDAVIQKATAKRPADRHQDVRELAEELRRSLLGIETPEAIALPPRVVGSAPAHNPYKGLRAFQEIDADDFFGRDALVDRLVARLAPEPSGAGPRAAGSQGRFLAVVGPSGAGKSSAVKAGLIPALRSGALPGSDRWFIAEMVPGSHPLEELEMALWPIAIDPPPSLVEPMQRDVRGMLRLMRRILPDEPGAQLLLVIDQFEELFTLVADEERRNFFLDSLLVALSAARSPLRVVITLRADFYDLPLGRHSLGQLLQRCTEVVLPLTPEELTWAIREPARRVGVAVETGLAEAMVADVADQPGALPLLQYALTELYEQREGEQLTLAAYRAIGGVDRALGRRADAIFTGFGADAERATRQLFLRLVRLGDGAADTRRRVNRPELESIAEAELPFVIDAYAEARLLTLDRDPWTRAATVEVAHEALLQNWERLRRWLDESRDEVRLQQQLAQAAAEWRRAGEDESYLLRGARLTQIENWSAGGSLSLATIESAFLAASLQARAGRQAKEDARRQRELTTARRLAETESLRAREQAEAARQLRRRARTLAGMLALALLLAVIAAVLGRRASGSAAIAADQARLAQSRELAAASLLSQATDPELSLLLATRALTTASTAEAEQALHLALLSSRVRQRFVGPAAAIQRAAVSSDGRLVALAAHGADRVTIWDAGSGRLLHELPIGAAWGLFFDEDGGRLAMAGRGASFSLAIWDTATGDLVEERSLPLPAATVRGYYVNPDWSRIALYGADESLAVWDLPAGERLFSLPGHGSGVEMEYSRDGRRLVSYDSTLGLVQVWDAGSGELLRRINTGEFINDHAVSPDGRSVALAVNAGGAGWQVQVWNIESAPPEGVSEPRLRLLGHLDTLRLVNYSADGRMIASAGADGTSRVWDARTGELLAELLHGSHVRTVTFHPDSRHLLSGDLNGVGRLWDISPQGSSERLTLVANDGPSYALALSPDGRTLATGGRARLWDIAAGAKVRDLIGHRDDVLSVAFHPSGQQVATAGVDGTAIVWDAPTGTPLLWLSGHGASLTGGIPGVLGVAYHPSGDWLATAGADGTIRLWDSASGALLNVLEGARADLSTVVFSLDGRYLASAEASGQRLNVVTAPTTVRLWDAGTGEALFSFDAGHGARNWGLAFSPDGRYLVTAGTDAAVRLWALDFGARRAALSTTLTAHSNTVIGVEFSPDGRLLATATPDEVRLWEVSAASDGATEAIVVRERLALPGGPALAFSADGADLITGGRDGLVRVYSLEQPALLSLARTRLTRGWTANECVRYLHREGCPPDASSLVVE